MLKGQRVSCFRKTKKTIPLLTQFLKYIENGSILNEQIFETNDST